MENLSTQQDFFFVLRTFHFGVLFQIGDGVKIAQVSGVKDFNVFTAWGRAS